MPDRIEPCLAVLASEPPKGNDWAFEIKWDGYRLAIPVEPTKVRILTRGGHDWTMRFSSIRPRTTPKVAPPPHLLSEGCYYSHF